MKLNNLKAALCILAVVAALPVYGQNSISGTVLDEEGNPLMGATVVVKNSSTGVITNDDGSFSLQTANSLPIVIEISYVGFESQSFTYNSLDSQTFNLSSANRFDEVIVSASRKAEKLQEAPAAVSVITADQVALSGGSVSPLRALINSPGVELQQQTGQRINIALRGANGVFSTNVFPMLDYRSLISPGLEYFDSQNSPLNTIDIERVEVVLGPGSALYGPDVTTGVIHFISKDPFKHPGTTLEIIGGERYTQKYALRHASHNDSETFGYKINMRYGKGKDFVLDPNDPDDQRVLQNFRTSINRASITSQGNVDTGATGTPLFSVPQEQEENYWAGAANASLYFRPKSGMEIVTSGGWNGGSAVFYNDLGEGQAQANEYWGQARFNYNGWFAQTYFITNDGGDDENPTYLNRTGLITPLERKHFEAQLQYNFNIESLFDSEWSTGFDYRNATANTQNHVYGRNENDDDYRIMGGYLQGKFKLDPKLDLFLAGRYDGYNFTDEKTFSPRAALVFKPANGHNIRLTYNKAANPIPASDIYFDLPTQSYPGLFDVWVFGAKNPYTFGGNNAIIDWVVPGVPNTPLAAGFPIAAAFQAVNNDLISQFSAALNADPATAALAPLVAQVLSNPATIPTGFATAVTTNLEGEPMLAEDGTGDLLSFMTSYELGYKGIIGDRFSFGFDIYHYRRKGGANFQQITPIATVVNLGQSLGQGVRANAQPALQQALAGLMPAAMATATAQQLGAQIEQFYGLAGDGFIQALSDAGLPFHGIVPTQENVGSADPMDSARLTFGYIRNDPDEVSEDWGAEVNFKYFMTDALAMQGNYTWFKLNDGEPGDLSFPQNKVRLGLMYTPEDKKFSGAVNYQWDQDYTSTNATFPGKIEAKSIVDLSLGYQINERLKMEVSAINLFNNEFRALPGFPRIGRTATARFLIDF